MKLFKFSILILAGAISVGSIKSSFYYNYGGSGLEEIMARPKNSSEWRALAGPTPETQARWRVEVDRAAAKEQLRDEVLHLQAPFSEAQKNDISDNIARNYDEGMIGAVHNEKSLDLYMLQNKETPLSGGLIDYIKEMKDHVDILNRAMVKRRKISDQKPSIEQTINSTVPEISAKE